MNTDISDQERLDKWKVEQNLPTFTRKIKKLFQPMLFSRSMKEALISSLKGSFVTWVNNHYPNTSLQDKRPERFEWLVNNCPNDVIFELYTSFLVWREMDTPDAKEEVLEFIFKPLTHGLLELEMR